MVLYEFLINGVVQRTVGKCWTTLLINEAVKDLGTAVELLNKKEVDEFVIRIKK